MIEVEVDEDELIGAPKEKKLLLYVDGYSFKVGLFEFEFQLTTKLLALFSFINLLR